jgi:hypothetical protein
MPLSHVSLPSEIQSAPRPPALPPSPARVKAEQARQQRSRQNATEGVSGDMNAPVPPSAVHRINPELKHTYFVKVGIRDSGLAGGWGTLEQIDLSYWKQHGKQYNLLSMKDYPTTEWEMARTDLYAQAQGVRHPDGQSFTGDLWYATEVELDEKQAAGPLHLMFPGLFNEAWLYVNGGLTAHREQETLWWWNDYRFSWDVDVAQRMKPGRNIIILRCAVPAHFGGIFRRPFLYRPVNAGK